MELGACQKPGSARSSARSLGLEMAVPSLGPDVVRRPGLNAVLAEKVAACRDAAHPTGVLCVRGLGCVGQGQRRSRAGAFHHP